MTAEEAARRFEQQLRVGPILERAREAMRRARIDLELPFGAIFDRGLRRRADRHDLNVVAMDGLDLVDDPIPIAHGLDRHRGAPLTSLEKLLERSAA